MAKDIKHLKTTCDHCGYAINVEKDGACPKCGATYNESKNVSRYNSLQDKMNQIQVDTAEAELESLKLDNARKKQELQDNQQNNNSYYEPSVTYQDATYGTSNFSHIKKVILIVVAILALILMLKMCGSNDYNPDVPEAESTIVETPTEVRFNEKADLIQYSIICDNIEEYYTKSQTPKDGFYFVRMHLIMTNKTNKDFKVWDSIRCTYLKNDYEIDAEANRTNYDQSSTKICGKTVSANTTTEGWVYFEVPIGSDIKLYCGDYVTINVSTAPTTDGKKVEVNFNELAETNRYDVTCDKAVQFQPYFSPAKGFMCVKMNLIIKNKMTSTLSIPKTIVCQYEKDGKYIECEGSTDSDLTWDENIAGQTIDANKTTEGWVCFEIPIGADILLTYNDYVTIRIPYKEIVKLN